MEKTKSSIIGILIISISLFIYSAVLNWNSLDGYSNEVKFTVWDQFKSCFFESDVPLGKRFYADPEELIVLKKDSWGISICRHKRSYMGWDGYAYPVDHDSEEDAWGSVLLVIVATCIEVVLLISGIVFLKGEQDELDEWLKKNNWL